MPAVLPGETPKVDYNGIIDLTWTKINQPWKVRDLQGLMLEPMVVVKPVIPEAPKAVEIKAKFDNMWALSKLIWIVVPTVHVVWHSIIWAVSNYGWVIDPLTDESKAAGETTWWTLWNIAMSMQLMMVLIFHGPLLVLGPISYIDDATIGFIFLFWAEVTTWY